MVQSARREVAVARIVCPEVGPRYMFLPKGDLPVLRRGARLEAEGVLRVNCWLPQIDGDPGGEVDLEDARLVK